MKPQEARTGPSAGSSRGGTAHTYTSQEAGVGRLDFHPTQQQDFAGWGGGVTSFFWSQLL